MSNSEKPRMNDPAFVSPAFVQEPVSAHIVRPDAIVAGAELRARLALTGLCGMATRDLPVKAISRQATRHLRSQFDALTMTSRFGRKIALPSTHQIIHELKMFAEFETARTACAEKIGVSPNSTWEQIRDHRLDAEAKALKA